MRFLKTMRTQRMILFTPKCLWFLEKRVVVEITLKNIYLIECTPKYLLTKLFGLFQTEFNCNVKILHFQCKKGR